MCLQGRDDGTFFAVKVSNGDHIPPEIHQVRSHCSISVVIKQLMFS
jgi:hypothetical protein